MSLFVSTAMIEFFTLPSNFISLFFLLSKIQNFAMALPVVSYWIVVSSVAKLFNFVEVVAVVVSILQ